MRVRFEVRFTSVSVVHSSRTLSRGSHRGRFDRARTQDRRTPDAVAGRRRNPRFVGLWPAVAGRHRQRDRRQRDSPATARNDDRPGNRPKLCRPGVAGSPRRRASVPGREPPGVRDSSHRTALLSGRDGSRQPRVCQALDDDQHRDGDARGWWARCSHLVRRHLRPGEPFAHVGLADRGEPLRRGRRGPGRTPSAPDRRAHRPRGLRAGVGSAVRAAGHRRRLEGQREGRLRRDRLRLGRRQRVGRQPARLEPRQRRASGKPGAGRQHVRDFDRAHVAARAGPKVRVPLRDRHPNEDP